MIQILLATRNAHKTREFRELLGDKFRVDDLSSANDVGDIAETGATFEENAKIKALAASCCSCNTLVVADDSGLEVDALGGAPGVYSARFAGATATNAENVAKLMLQLQHVNAAERSARFRCVLVVGKNGEVLRVCDGTVEGRIADAPRGTNGFGYDPVFVPAGFAQTFGELPPETKHALSHRARAVIKLREFLL